MLETKMTVIGMILQGKYVDFVKNYSDVCNFKIASYRLILYACQICLSGVETEKSDVSDLIREVDYLYPIATKWDNVIPQNHTFQKKPQRMTSELQAIYGIVT